MNARQMCGLCRAVAAETADPFGRPDPLQHGLSSDDPCDRVRREARSQALNAIAILERRDDERATEVIRRLHGLLKRAPFEARTIDLNASVKEAVDLLLPVIKQRSIAVEINWSLSPILVSADPVQIQQVVINLVRNSSDAIVESAALERVIAISISRRGGSAELLVVDSGGGIPVANLQKLFDPFFSTKKEGMGVGLSIVRTIVRAHSGTISAENANGGATFRVTLPISEA